MRGATSEGVLVRGEGEGGAEGEGGGEGGGVPGVGLDAASAWTTTDALRVRSARACTPRCCDPALTACSASSRGCSSSRPTTAANTSASASARRTSTVVNIRVAGLRVPPRLGLALLAALERGADGETSGLRLVERIALRHTQCAPNTARQTTRSNRAPAGALWGYGC